MVVIRLVRRYRCRLSNRNSVSPPSASSIADSVIGKGRSGFTGPMISASVTCNSWPCSLSVASTTPLITTLDSIRAFLSASKHSSPTKSLLATHCTVPVESLTTRKRILFEPRVLWTHPFSSTFSPSCEPDLTSPIQYFFPIVAPVLPSWPTVMKPRLWAG